MLENIALLVSLFIFQIVWILYDPRPKKMIIKSYLGLNGGYSMVYIMLVLFVALAYPYLPFKVSLNNGLVSVIAVTLYLLGYTLAIWTRLTMKSNWSSAGETDNSNSKKMYIINGPFKFIRHPMYTGIVLLYTGISLMTLSITIEVSTIILTIYLYQCSANEDKKRESIFPSFSHRKHT